MNFLLIIEKIIFYFIAITLGFLPLMIYIKYENKHEFNYTPKSIKTTNFFIPYVQMKGDQNVSQRTLEKILHRWNVAMAQCSITKSQDQWTSNGW
jgi:aminopeptidase C